MRKLGEDYNIPNQLVLALLHHYGNAFNALDAAGATEKLREPPRRNRLTKKSTYPTNFFAEPTNCGNLTVIFVNFPGIDVTAISPS